MPGLTDNESNKLYNHVVRQTNYPSQGFCYIALFTSAPTDSAFGTEVPLGVDNYNRLQFEGTTTLWEVPASGQGRNAALANFGQSTPAGGGWGTIVAAALMSSQTGATLADMVAYGLLLTPRAVGESDTFQFPINNITVNMNSNN